MNTRLPTDLQRFALRYLHEEPIVTIKTWYDYTNSINRSTPYRRGLIHGVDHYYLPKRHGERVKLERTVPYINGILHGRVAIYHENTQTIDTHLSYVNGKKHGLQTSWYWCLGGQHLMRRQMWQNDELNGLSETWYLSGQLISQGYYTDNHVIGLWKSWTQEGELTIVDAQTLPSRPVFESTTILHA
jgi:antitoxin component YwqK of YwqJK toxin-antitoxin module